MAQFQFYVGGVPNQQEGLLVTQNFTGCIENMYLNSTNLIHDVKDAYEYGYSVRYEKVNTLYSCPVGFIRNLMKKYRWLTAGNIAGTSDNTHHFFDPKLFRQT